ncbi:SigI regulator RsgI, partial [Alkalihalophilus pseudofirmus]|nr:SigI regulator RsgI [Alkalihalophilus pseudofirmus]
MNRFHYFFRAKPVLLTTLVIIIFMSLLFPLYRNDKAYAYLSIDVNPSIELGVNEKMQVIEMTGFNK